jgi:hypothetical protein
MDNRKRILPKDRKYRKRSVKNYIDKSNKPNVAVYDLIYRLLDLSTVEQDVFEQVDKLLK